MRLLAALQWQRRPLMIAVVPAALMSAGFQPALHISGSLAISCYQRDYLNNMGHTEVVLDILRGKLLTLHKTLVDLERVTYERIHGKKTSGEFLTVLLD